MKSCEIFLLLKIRTMATKFSPCKGSYVLNQFPSNVMFGMNGFHVSASGAIQGHHGPLVFFSLKLDGTEIGYLLCGISLWTSTKFVHKMPLGSKLAPPWESHVEHRNKERKFHNSSTLKLEGLEPWYFVCSISFRTSTKCVHTMPLGSGLVLPWGSQVRA